MVALDTLHQAGYVHSDVRASNILFPLDGGAKLIDFDLANEVNVPYPQGYRFIKNERHMSAQEDKPRKIIHDRYSLIVIIEKQIFYSTLPDDVVTKLNQVKYNEQPLLASIFIT